MGHVEDLVVLPSYRGKGLGHEILRRLKDYGFDISREELINYIQPLLMKINEVTPLKNGNN